MRELGVAVLHVHPFGARGPHRTVAARVVRCQGIDAIRQREQGAVDVGAFVQSCAAVVGGGGALGAGQIDEGELGLHHHLLVLAGGGLLGVADCEEKDRVRARGDDVHLRGFGLAVAVAHVEHLDHLVVGADHLLRGPRRHHDSLVLVFSEREDLAIGLEQVVHLFVVHFDEAHAQRPLLRES